VHAVQQRRQQQRARLLRSNEDARGVLHTRDTRARSR
jgi:hypothetical protein